MIIAWYGDIVNDRLLPQFSNQECKQTILFAFFILVFLNYTRSDAYFVIVWIGINCQHFTWEFSLIIYLKHKHNNLLLLDIIMTTLHISIVRINIPSSQQQYLSLMTVNRNWNHISRVIISLGDVTICGKKSHVNNLYKISLNYIKNKVRY